ncbi:hypothetical protein L0B53_13485 [Vibrio sp. SS-MA-C1-2]|uniref:hypothetical protein n=1 Tax=Vibrio sp. SS-MA-C1-2 TaxID=2908646 RepID=UPI001F1A02D4|nr:hypothetical protein [Vibrio sp. SS-MA-C1-2]UJF18031.1 hypothetical protein L0B53_13485 [Vibrio sp. SS-MA-C1-2]
MKTQGIKTSVGGAVNAQTSRIKKAKSTAAVTSSTAVQASTPLFPKLQLSERPQLIAELSDNHKIHSSLALARELIKQILSGLLQIKKIALSGEYTPDSMNRVDIYKKQIMAAVNTQLFGHYILDSSFNAVGNSSSFIEFTIPGLDLNRERLTDELVTLYINNKMVPLAFDRTESKQTLFTKFSLMFGYSQLQLQLGSEKELIIGMNDQLWRKWNGVVYVSGQGGRFASGTPMTIEVIPNQVTVENITTLDMNDKALPEKVDLIIKGLQANYQLTLNNSQSQNQASEHLIALCSQSSIADAAMIRHQFITDPQVSLMSVYRQYQGPNRTNVTKLLNNKKL